jgi:hypothetical protein
MGNVKLKPRLIALLLIAPCILAPGEPKKTRISLTARSNVSTSEVGKELDRRCPEITITDDPQRADYELEAWDTGAGPGRKPYKFTLFKNGDRMFSTETRGLAGAVKDVCGFLTR